MGFIFLPWELSHIAWMLHVVWL